MIKLKRLFVRKHSDERKRAAIEGKAVRLLKKRNYKFKNKLGSGSFGDVFLMEKPNKTLIAAKILLPKYTSIGEMTLWPSFNHPNVLPLLQMICTQDMNIFLMPYHPSTFDEVLKSRFFRYNQRSFDIIKKWVREIACGLEYLHLSNFHHCDLKLDNVLITSDITAVICDFSSVGETTELVKRYALPQCYCPPEACRSLGRPPVDGKALDIWAFGIVALNACTNHWIEKGIKNSLNWKKDTYPTLLKALQLPTFRSLVKKAFPYSSISESDSSDMLNLIQGTMRYNPEDRPHASAILRHTIISVSQTEARILLVPDIQWSVDLNDSGVNIKVEDDKAPLAKDEISPDEKFMKEPPMIEGGMDDRDLKVFGFFRRAATPSATKSLGATVNGRPFDILKVTRSDSALFFKGKNSVTRELIINEGVNIKVEDDKTPLAKDEISPDEKFMKEPPMIEGGMDDRVLKVFGFFQRAATPSVTKSLGATVNVRPFDILKITRSDSALLFKRKNSATRELILNEGDVAALNDDTQSSVKKRTDKNSVVVEQTSSKGKKGDVAALNDDTQSSVKKRNDKNSVVVKQTSSKGKKETAGKLSQPIPRSKGIRAWFSKKWKNMKRFNCFRPRNT